MSRINAHVSKRIHSYDFFQGILATELIFYMTFLKFFPFFSTGEIFYRWSLLGFLFFSGIIIGEVLLKKKSVSNFFFFRRGLQIFAIFIAVNIFSFFSQHSFYEWQQFSLKIIKGDSALVANLLLPFSALYLLIPFLSYIPSFLGFLWSLLGFFLLDLLFLEKNIVSVNLLFLTIGMLGFYTGKIHSLDKIRLFLYKHFSVLPFVFLYIAIAILTIGGIFKHSFLNFFSMFSLFWSFHFLILMLFYFSIPSLIFYKEKKKSSLRKFFETLGVEILFIYILVSILLSTLHFIFSDVFLEDTINPFVLSIHFTIFSFSIVLLIKKISNKSKKFKKYFRFIF